MAEGSSAMQDLRSKSSILLEIGFASLLILACGGSKDTGSSSEVDSEGITVVGHDTPADCRENVPAPEAPQTYCKTIASGETVSVQLKPSHFVQDPETCVITVIDDGIKETILEMGFALCE